MIRRTALCVSLVAGVALSGLGGMAHAEMLGDAARGESLFRDCSACHQVGEGAAQRMGPHLNNLFGRKAGSVGDSARYSKGLIRAGADGLVWDHRTLDAYVENPKALVSDTRMAYRGMKDAQDRADLLAYLRKPRGRARWICHRKRSRSRGTLLMANIWPANAWPATSAAARMTGFPASQAGLPRIS